jgi:hypothetical protein
VPAVKTVDTTGISIPKGRAFVGQGRGMLLWRMKFTRCEGDAHGVECHLIRRDMEYRLSVRTDKAVVVQEVHRTMVTAAERAEELRRQAIEGEIGC